MKKINICDEKRKKIKITLDLVLNVVKDKYWKNKLSKNKIIVYLM